MRVNFIYKNPTKMELLFFILIISIFAQNIDIEEVREKAEVIYMLYLLIIIKEFRFVSYFRQFLCC